MTTHTPLLRGRDRAMWHSTLLVFGASALVALAAQVEVPMLPVPMSLQTLAISVVGLTLGARLAGLALLAYLGQGAMGLPVFSGGDAGLAYMFGPTGGFLIGFAAMAWLTGFLAEQGFARGFWRMFVAAFVPATLLFAPGVAWLWSVTPLNLGGALMAGMVPFLLGDVVKSSLAALIVSGCWRASRK
jgi:biotin transport system substrate-specific component